MMCEDTRTFRANQPLHFHASTLLHVRRWGWIWSWPLVLKRPAPSRSSRCRSGFGKNLSSSCFSYCAQSVANCCTFCSLRRYSLPSGLYFTIGGPTPF
jgi:hypothetical protein